MTNPNTEQVIHHSDKTPDRAHRICANCGHYFFLHNNNFKGECDACDTPEIPIEQRCPGFQEHASPKSSR